MDWQTVKGEFEDGEGDMDGLDLDTFVTKVLESPDFNLPHTGAYEMMENGAGGAPFGSDGEQAYYQPQQQHLHQQQQFYQQQAVASTSPSQLSIEEALASHPFFASDNLHLQQQQQQHHFSNPFQPIPDLSGPSMGHGDPSPRRRGSSNQLAPLPEIQISAFPTTPAMSISAGGALGFHGFSSPLSTSPTSSAVPGSSEQPIRISPRTSPSSSGRTSPLNLSAQALPVAYPFGSTSSAGTPGMSVPITFGAIPASTATTAAPVEQPGSKRKKPPKKKQASLPNLLPAPGSSSSTSSSQFGTLLSTSPNSASFLATLTAGLPAHDGHAAGAPLAPGASGPSLPSSPAGQPYSPTPHSLGSSPPSSPRTSLTLASSWMDQQAGKPTLTVPGMAPHPSLTAPKILRVNYDEVIFSAAKTPSKVTVVCTPTTLRPLGVECLINRPNMTQPVVVQPTQISIHDDSNEQRVATCTVIECHFPFPTVMKTCIGGVKVANVQFRLFHAPHSSSSSSPILLDTFYRDGEKRHLPMVAYPHTKAKIQCWAIIIWYADRGPEHEQLTWAELAKRFAYFYKRQLNENMHPQSIRFLGEKLGIPNAGKESSKDEIVTFETYMQTRVGHWLYNAVQAIKSYYDLWRNYSLRMFLTHKDAVILLKQMGAQPGDFLFRIPSQLAEEDTKAFKTRSPSSTLVFTYVQKVGDEIRFAKVDVNDKVREDPKFIHEKKELVNVLCLNEKGEMILRHKLECFFNDKQKKMKENSNFKGAVKVSSDDGDEYETY